MGDHNVFTTPQQNILIAKMLCDTIEPMLTEDHAATLIVTRIKAMCGECRLGYPHGGPIRYSDRGWAGPMTPDGIHMDYLPRKTA